MNTSSTPLTSRPSWYRRIPIGWVIIIGFLMLMLCYPMLLMGRALVPRIYSDQGDHALLNGQHATARAAYVKAMDWSMDGDDPFDQRWRLAETTMEIQLAIDDFTAIIIAHPERWLGYCYRAQAYTAVKRSTEALADYQACMERTPNTRWNAKAHTMIQYFQRQP